MRVNMEGEKKLQKEQERERRRLRDRQRRQAMSVEEREKHLARRRKNYQLRRLRAENAKLDLEEATKGQLVEAKNAVRHKNLGEKLLECNNHSKYYKRNYRT